MFGSAVEKKVQSDFKVGDKVLVLCREVGNKASALRILPVNSSVSPPTGGQAVKSTRGKITSINNKFIVVKDNGGIETTIEIDINTMFGSPVEKKVQSDFKVGDWAMIVRRQADNKTVAMRVIPANCSVTPLWRELLAALKVAPGSWAETVEAEWGKPTQDYLLPNFNPQTMRRMTYSDKGLEITLNNNLVCEIVIKSSFRGEVGALRIGNPIDRAFTIYGKSDSTSKGYSEFLGCTRYLWHKSSNWKDVWSVWAKDDKIVGLGFENRRIFGEWNFIPK